MSGLANKRRFAWRAVFFPLPSHLLLRYLQLIRSAPTRKRCRRSDETPNYARCSEPGHRALVAIHASRGPGR